MTWFKQVARSFGYDLVPRKKAKALNAQLVAILDHHRIDTVLDVGANVGQYGQRLRAWGYGGRIISFEPLEQAHAMLCSHAARDHNWEVAPRMAVGAEDGVIDIQVSAETDMSSILPQSELLRRISPSSAIMRIEEVPLRCLDSIAPGFLRDDDRVFLKVDTQGFEPKVLDGAVRLLPRLIGLQLEMSLVPLYHGERDYLAMIKRLGAAGFQPHLFLPGYFERKLARQLEIDGIFIRANRGDVA